MKTLEKCLEIALADEPARAVRVTLAMTGVDREGRQLLARMQRQDVRLDSAGALMTAMVEQIEAEMGEEQSWALRPRTLLAAKRGNKK